MAAVEGPPANKKKKVYKRPSIRERVHSEPLVDAPPYYSENGLRKVHPYWFKYRVFAKQRWYGQPLVEVLQRELYTSFPGFFAKAILSGRVTVNDQPTTVDYAVQNGDLIRHLCHRHELPVLDRAVQILENTDDLLVVDKPCSLPVHPCGRYHFNSLLAYLKHVHGFDNLKMLHRLDRLTSGLVILLKNASTEKRFRRDLLEGRIEKEYVCKVDGHFPDGEVVCDQPLDVLFKSMGLMRVCAEGKASRTRFRRVLAVDGGRCSLVKCCPETGRTHQIRVHLQYLGFPIVDDAIYGDAVFGAKRGAGGDYGKPLTELEVDVRRRFAGEHWFTPGVMPDDSRGSSLEDDCPQCAVTAIDPSQSDLEMCLHCYRYSGPGWSFQSPLPAWASDLQAIKI